MNQSLKSLGQAGGSMWAEELVKELKLPVSYNCKAWRWLGYGGVQLQNEGFTSA